MRGMLFAERAIFVKLESVGRVLLVFVHVVIALFTFGARKSYLRSGSFSSHRFAFLRGAKLAPQTYFNIKLTPRTRDVEFILLYS